MVKHLLIYYTVSPILVKKFSNLDGFKNIWKPILDYMVTKLNNKGIENTPYSDIM